MGKNSLFGLAGFFGQRSVFPAMNQAGMIQIFLVIMAVLLFIILLPPIVMVLFPIADILIRIILVFLIFSTVRGYLGSSILSVIISGVLIYFLVIKWAYFTAAVYVAVFFLLTLQVFSIVIFGIGMGMRKF